LPVKLIFRDYPGRDSRDWPFTWEGILEVACPISSKSPNYRPLTTINYGFGVDVNGNATLLAPSGNGNVGDCGKIIVTANSVRIIPSTQTQSYPIAELTMEAYYIGCCEEDLNWVQTINTTAPRLQRTSPYTDDEASQTPPYYMHLGTGEWGIQSYTTEQTAISNYPITCP